jgi:hypothetical protein
MMDELDNEFITLPPGRTEWKLSDAPIITTTACEVTGVAQRGAPLRVHAPAGVRTPLWGHVLATNSADMGNQKIVVG